MSKVRIAIAAAGALAALVATVVPGTAAEAATNPVQVTFVYYDAPGRDTSVNKSVNGEFVRVTNTGTTAKVITGWTLRDQHGHVYRFPATKLNPGKSVLVYTGRSSNTVAHKYWGRTSHVWGNTSGKAILRTASGALADTCTWTSVRRGFTNC